MTSPTINPTPTVNPLNATPTDTSYSAYETRLGYPQTTSENPGSTVKYDPNNPFNVDVPGTGNFAGSSNPTNTPYNYNPTTTNSNTGSSNTDALVQTQNDLSTYAKNVSDTISGITNGTIPLTPGEQAQVNGLQEQFQQFIDQQKQVNGSANGLAQIRGFQSGAAEYDPSFQVRTIGAIVQAGNNKVTDLMTKEASAVASLTQALRNNDIKGIQDAYSAYKDANTARQDALKTSIAATQGAIKDAHIQNVIASGVTNPGQILSTLQSQGYTDISSSDINSAIKNLSPDAADIFKIQQDAAANGADQKTLALIAAAPDKQTALQIASQGNVANNAVLSLAQKYPDAGIVPGDSLGQANAKVLNSATYTNAQKAAALDLAYKQSEINKNNSGTGTDTSGTGRAIGTTGSPKIDATTPGYSTDIVPGTGGLTQAAIDQDALATALGQPLPVPLGLSSTGAGGQKRTAINNRMAELNASGNVAANKTVLAANADALKTQVGYMNNVQRAFNTANDTFDALNSWMKENGVNPSQFPDFNKFSNFLKSKGIDPGQAGGYNAQIATLRQEYSQVLAKGGARSVETDQQAQQLIPDGLSPAQLQTVADRIKVDADNVINDSQKQVQAIQDKINNIVSGQPTFNFSSFDNGGTGNQDSTSNGVDLSKFQQ
jgi:hypothetical protein